MAIPSAPVITSPADGATVSGVITVEWGASTFPDVVAPSFIASSAAVFAPTVVAGAAPNTIAPSFIASTAQVFAPTVVAGSGSSVFVEDSLTNNNATTLDSHTGETGAAWAQHSLSDTGSISIRNDGIISVAASASQNHQIYYASGVPASADYDVQALFRLHNANGPTGNGATGNGIVGRLSTSAWTGYIVTYNFTNTRFDLVRVVSSTRTVLASWAQAMGGEHTVVLQMRGTGAQVDLTVLVDGVVRITHADTHANRITAANRAGMVFTRYGMLDGGLWYGVTLDDFVATDA